jgi:hypothetical protein
MFVGTAGGTLLFYSFYQSRYATGMLDRAAAGISHTSRISFGYENISETDSGDGQNDFGKLAGGQDTDCSHRDRPERSKMADVEGQSDGGRKVKFESPLLETAIPLENNPASGPSQTQGLIENPQPPEATVSGQGPVKTSADTLVVSSLVPPHGVMRPESKAVEIVKGIAEPRKSVASQANNNEPLQPNLDDLQHVIQSNASHQDPETPIYIEDEIPGAYLTLYKVSMLVERMFSSTFFDDHWAIGLSEKRLYTAIELLLKNDQALGSQFAIFSFTGVSMSAAGSTLNNASERFSFAVFAVLAAAGFLCGITCSVLSGMLLRQISLTQTKEEGTAHEFSEEFGFYLRMIGGLNSFAGIFIATAIFHFLLSIFQVTPAIALPLGAIWIVTGSVLLESFMASFSYWSLNEVFEDLGELVEPPEMNSPSPVTGTLQQIIRLFNKCILRRDRNKDE